MTVDPPPARPPSVLLSLQVLRAVAALLVLLHHAGYEADGIAARAGARPLALDRFLDLGFGVHLFFVLSGFIVLRTARGFGSGRGAAVFAVRRAIRVAPLYWLLTTATLVGGAVAPRLLNGTAGGPGWVLGSYLFVPVARPNGAINPVLGQGWTLDYEMFFYALFAVAMLLPRRVGVATLAAALVTLVALGGAFAPPFAAASVWTDGLLLEFLFGLALALVAERGFRLGPAGAALAAAAGVLGAVAMGPLSGRSGDLAPWVREGVPAALVVAACAVGPRWKAGRTVVALALVGDASYSLYLSHPFAVRLMGVAWGGWGAAVPGWPAGPWPYLGSACAVAVVAALALHRFVERPMTEALQRATAAGRSARPLLPDSADGPADPARPA